ncbi:MAG: hypothetical protein V1678_00030 [Candidatus Aenigmatarchaeota archaeon]
MKFQLLILLLVSIAISGCTNIPPGCRQIPFIAGGCFGTNTIRDLKIEPTLPDCVQIDTSNCNGAEIYVYNNCSEELVINGEIINHDYTSLPFILKDERVVLSNNTFFPPNPKEDENIIINGNIGDTNFTITYIRTKSLC